MKYKLDKQINEVAVGVHNKGRTSKSGFVGVVIRPLSYLCGHVPLINNDKYECVYTARDKTAVHQIPTRQTRRSRVEPITRRYMYRSKNIEHEFKKTDEHKDRSFCDCSGMRRSQNEDWYAAKTLPKESLTHFAILSQYFSILLKIPQNAQKISVKAMNIPTMRKGHEAAVKKTEGGRTCRKGKRHKKAGEDIKRREERFTGRKRVI
ncbi:hypothetical protein EAG_14189 [Camponotus floridanus]|uniref:Uncharacterized protein n=1 Tax=Camponotus floridanus TaxID=104421 RepID=E2A2U8_CAMFO|nr:hypothetical protein EAG_14189 [Camponotus floridanus]